MTITPPEFRRSKEGFGLFRKIEEPGRFEFAYWSIPKKGWINSINVTGYWLHESNEVFPVTDDEAVEFLETHDGSADDLMAETVETIETE